MQQQIKLRLILSLFTFVHCISHFGASEWSPGDLTVVTIAPKWTDSLGRYMEMGSLHNLQVIVIGLHGAVNSAVNAVDKEGDGELNYSKKISLLTNELNKRSNQDDDVILFTESQNFLFLAQPTEILDRFRSIQADIVLATDVTCDHGKSLDKNFVAVGNTRCLFNGGGFIGYKSKILKALEIIQSADKSGNDASAAEVESISSKLFQIQEVDSVNIKLDSKSKLFYNLNRAFSQIKQLNGTGGAITLKDMMTNTKILVLHGDGPNRGTLDYYGNQMMNWVGNGEGSESAHVQNAINLKNVPDDQLPTVTLAVFIDHPTPFLEEFFNKIGVLDYFKQKIYLLVYNHIKTHIKAVDQFLARWPDDYVDIKVIGLNDNNVGPREARTLAVDWALQTNSNFYFSVDSAAHLDNPRTLKHLVEQNRGIISPMLLHSNKLWPNFGMDLEQSPGFYDKIQNYLDVLKGKRRGLWNVPFITSVYLVSGAVIRDTQWRPNFTPNFAYDDGAPVDAAFCWHNCKNGVFMYLDNLDEFGHLINLADYEQNLAKGRLHGELLEFFNNRQDWEGRYLHPDYFKSLEDAAPLTSLQPCPDVYLFPALTQRFCDELIAEMEHHGNWSGFSLYEADDPAPTSDIGLSQIGIDKQWFEFLRAYIQPLQQRVYPYYSSKTFAMDIPFVIRYKPDGRKMLNPHLDESTYTINVALNMAGKDFEGGGVRFTRYNCSVLDNKPGWLLMHPGKLSHQHHGLVVTKGVRYVLISFIDPPDFLGILEKDQKH